MDFIDPIPGRFTYVGWTIDPRTRGPVVRHSPKRTAFLNSLREVLPDLTRRPGVAQVRLLETTFIPPLPARPNFDVITLVDAATDVEDEIHELVRTHDLPAPSFTAALVNAARFGDTDAHPGPILLNHFTGSVAPEPAVAAWQRTSRWYESVIGIDNSTLLAFDPGTPYVVVNYAAIPSAVGPFLLNQLARPSFYRSVAKPLSQVGLRPCPLFARRWAL